MPGTKLTQEYILTDSSLNVYGMRLLTSGYDLPEFLKNPIGYYGHKKDDGVLIRWYDVRLDGDQVFGKPEINMEHPRADRTIKEVNEGFLNCASVGKLKILEYHLEDNPDDPENPIVVVTKWYNKECSLVDNPGNRAAMKVELFDEEEEINLEDAIEVFKSKKHSMRKIELPINKRTLSLLNLSDKSESEVTADDIVQGIQDLHDENETLTKAKDKAEKELKEEKATGVTNRVNAILDKGLEDKKYTVETRKKLAKTYADNPDDLEDLVKDMQPFQSVNEAIKNTKKEVDGDRLAELNKKSWGDLDLADELEELKLLDEESYNKKLDAFKKERRNRKA